MQQHGQIAAERRYNTGVEYNNMDKMLFAGIPAPGNGVSNQQDLIPHIPAKFRDWNNPWSRMVDILFFYGSDASTWSWRPELSEEDRLKRARLLHSALTGFALQHETKTALCAWMLSEMLTEPIKR